MTFKAPLQALSLKGKRFPFRISIPQLKYTGIIILAKQHKMSEEIVFYPWEGRSFSVPWYCPVYLLPFTEEDVL